MKVVVSAVLQVDTKQMRHVGQSEVVNVAIMVCVHFSEVILQD